ncbi:MAG: DUF4397 domain-containing protein [Gammaproteobacteria bacterium]|nr:DUF4397 domain-containing protein [Gammaproteobacteria bacterium]
MRIASAPFVGSVTNMLFWIRLRTVTALLSVVIITGCGSDPGFNEETDFILKEGSAQFINLMPDSPELTIIHGLTQSQARHAESSGIELRYEDKYDWRIAYLDADSREVTVARQDDQQITENMLSTFLIMGNLTQPNILVVDVSVPTPDQLSDDSSEVWFGSNLSATSMVDVYVTDFGLDLSEASPLTSVDSGGYTNLFTVDAGDSRQLRITVAGTKDLLFDSGILQIPGQNLILFALADNFGPNGSAHIKVVSSSLSNSESIADVSQETKARVASFSDTESLNVAIGSNSFDSITRGSPTDYRTTPAGTQTFTVSLDGSTIIEDSGTLTTGEFHSLMVFDNPDTDPELLTFIVADRFRNISDRVLFQFVNGSSQTIDFYALRIDQSQEDFAPTYNDIQNVATGVTEILSGQARFIITNSSGSETLASTELNLTEGTSYTVVFDSSGELQVLQDQ